MVVVWCVVCGVVVTGAGRLGRGVVWCVCSVVRGVCVVWYVVCV